MSGYEKLKKEKEVLDKKFNRWRKVEGNIKTGKEVSDSDRRIMLNNEDYFYSQGGLLAYQFKEDGKVNIDNQYRVVERMGDAWNRAGDPLCTEIMKYFEEEDIGYSHSKLILMNSSIPGKIFLRTMTEKEYLGYLNGKLPFGSYKGVECFLPKQQVKLDFH